MRTITEFFGMTLKTAAEKIPALTAEAKAGAAEAMKAEGKTDEEIAAGLPAAEKAAVDAKIGEVFKLEGDKLAMFANALEMVKDARGTVKRILVQAKAKEDEKAPSNAKEIDGKFYVIEGFPEAKREEPRDERGGKFGDKRGGKGGKPREGDRGGRGAPRGDGAPRAAEGGAGGGGRPPRAPRADAGAPGFQTVTGDAGRAPRAPRAPVEPYKGPNRIGSPAKPAGASDPSSAT
jgi:hypothetical protein